MDMFIPVPEGTVAADVECSITPNQLSVKLKNAGTYLLQGPLWGRIHLDGSYWCINDRAVEAFDGQNQDISFGLKKGGTFIEVYLDKKAPSDVIWPDVFDGVVEEDTPQ
jgi:CS domain